MVQTDRLVRVGRKTSCALAVLAATVIGACTSQHSTTTSPSQERTAEPAAAQAVVAPGLAVGDRAPDATLTTLQSGSVSLASFYKDGPIVLAFYRGGWCPICNRALMQWQDKLDDVQAAGGTFIALTPEKPDHAAATIDKGDLTYTVLSDTQLEAAKAFRVHFVVDDATKTKYMQFGMNVAEANSTGTWELPAPATFVIDRQGVIRYAFADWDYTKRADPDTVIAAVRSLTGRP
ncbi:MAG: AhpC/TSA family protein [Phycisphaerales bacterium]|nr:AhpC/TSA family protein [Phycisphaerales bacterium]